MSKYTSKVRYTLDFEGDTVKVVTTRLKRKDFLKLMPRITALKDLLPEKEGGEGEDIKLSPEAMLQQAEFLDIAIDMLPKYIVSISGLVDSVGENIEVSEILDSAYFIELVGEIAGKLIEEASPQDEKETKNLGGQLASDSTDSQTTR